MKRLLTLAGALALMLLAGCGGDDDGDSASTRPTQAEGSTTIIERSQEPRRDPQGQADGVTSPGSGGDATQRTSSDSGPGPTPGAKEVAPGVPVAPGGDNSIQIFGVEGQVSEREQAAAATRAYLTAFAAGDWADACMRASRELKQSLQLPLAGEKQRRRMPDCATALRRLTSGAPASVRRRVARVDRVLSFRAEDRQGFLIFRSGETVKYMPMALEGGEWKVGGLEPSEFFLGP